MITFLLSMSKSYKLSFRGVPYKDNVTRMGDYRRGFGLEIVFSDHFNTELVTTINYSAIADLHTSQITRGHRPIFSIC
jgi:hypothetical protein